MRSAATVAAFFLTITTTLSAQTVIDRIVAVVGKEIITESELSERTTLFALQNRLDPILRLDWHEWQYLELWAYLSANPQQPFLNQLFWHVGSWPPRQRSDRP